MKRIHLFLFFVMTLFPVLTQAAGNISFSVNVPPGNIPVGSKFPVTFVLKNASGPSSSVPTPQLPGCKLLYGPTVVNSQSYQVVNGRSTGSSSTEYTFYYKAEAEGTHTIGSISVTVDGKKYSSKPTSIKVVKGSQTQQQTQQSSSSSRPVSIDDYTTQSSDRAIKGNDVFVRISTSRSSVYEQEALECTIKLYTKYNIAEFMQITQPAFNGFTVEDLPIQASLNDREMINGQEYATAVVKKCILFPQKSGNLTIMSGTYDLTVVQYDQVNLGFYSIGQPRTKKIRVNSNNASVSVSPLPSPQPAGFSGAVGKFDVKTDLKTTQLRTNEPSTLSYTITGNGNVRYIKDPDIDFPVEFEQYSPQHNVDAKVEGNNVVGISQTDFTFVPKETGNYKIVVPDFVYFDPGKKEYVTIHGREFDVKVVRGAGSSSGDRQDLTTKNSDILYIKESDGPLSKTQTFVIDKIGYWLLYIIITLLVASLVVFVARRNKLAADVTGMKRSKANRVAKRRLKLAAKYMNTKQTEQFYAEMLKAMWGYFSDKFSIPGSDLTRDKIREELSKRTIDESIIEKTFYILDYCEMARYTPSSTTSQQINEIYALGCEVINGIERQKV